MIISSTNRRSHCTTSPNLVVIREVAIDFGDGLVHMRQMRQVSTTELISFFTDSGTPAACRMSCILLALACHHLVCNLLRALV